MNIVDLSGRRGAIVHLLPDVYELLKKNDSSILNKVLWTHDINKVLVDINYKWVFALEGTNVLLGMMFYQLGSDGESVYINTLAAKNIAPGKNAILEALLKKFEQDATIKLRKSFYVSREIKREASVEILETVGLQDESVYDNNGYQLLGDLGDTVNALKIRYLR
ncbi:MAG: hypothetical protein FWC91_05735 [Defluviitaleaceae bacterium]|nr:hypothetical protein [Defluviitaleaceae bacterium]